MAGSAIKLVHLTLPVQLVVVGTPPKYVRLGASIHDVITTVPNEGVVTLLTVNFFTTAPAGQVIITCSALDEWFFPHEGGVDGNRIIASQALNSNGLHLCRIELLRIFHTVDSHANLEVAVDVYDNVVTDWTTLDEQLTRKRRELT
jgi:hypothetical protein